MARRQVKASNRVILVVDDQEEALVSTKALLEREGHRVLTAASGEIALSIFRQHDVDLVLVDFFMPRMDGDQLVRAIRSLDPFVQIVLQTAYAGQKPPRAMLAELDIQGYHDKGEGPERLLQWVDVSLKARDKLADLRVRERNTLQQPLVTAEKIMLVGDRTVLAWLQARLTADGRQVLRCESVTAALEIFVRELPHVMVVTRDSDWAATVDLVRRARALEPALPVIVYGSEIAVRERARVVAELEGSSVHDSAEGPERLVELIEVALGTVRRLRRAGADEELRRLIVARFCHQVRGAIHVLHGYAEIIRDEATEPQIKIFAERLAFGGESALGVVQQYLDLVRLESPGLGIRCEPVDIDELFGDLATTARRHIGERNVVLETLVPVSGMILHTDGEKLRAILAELLMNAVKFTESGKLLMQARCVAGGTEFALHDSGPGIDQEGLSLLFEPFRQAAGDRLTSVPGQGLGLALALRLSALLGGRLSADRGATGGAIFTLSLPMLLEPKERDDRVLLH